MNKPHNLRYKPFTQNCKKKKVKNGTFWNWLTNIKSLKTTKSPILIGKYEYKIYNLFEFVLNHITNWDDPILRGANNRVNAVEWEGDLAVPWGECKITQIYLEENTACVWKYNIKETVQIYIKGMLGISIKKNNTQKFKNG